MQTEKQKNNPSNDQHIQSYQSEDTGDQNNIQDTLYKETTRHFSDHHDESDRS